MKRYTTSFFISLLIYTIVGFSLYYIFDRNIVINEPKEKLQKISLNQIELQPMIEEKVIEKVVEKKKEFIEKEKPIEKPKKEVVKKNIVEHKKKVEKQEDIKQEEVIEEIKKPEKQIEPIKEEKIATEKTDSTQQYIKANLVEIRKLINNHVTYPSKAKKLNIQGKVRIKFKINKNGEISDIEVFEGHKFLQKATIEAINEASKKFPISNESVEIEIPIEFKLI